VADLLTGEGHIASAAVQPQTALAAVTGEELEPLGGRVSREISREVFLDRVEQPPAQAVVPHPRMDDELGDPGGPVLVDPAAHGGDHLIAEPGHQGVSLGYLGPEILQGLDEWLDLIVAVELRLTLVAQILQLEDVLRVLRRCRCRCR
jgi:hypothetical protein